MNRRVLGWNFVFQYGFVLTNIFNSMILLPLYLRNIAQDTLGLWLATGNILAWMTLADPGVGDVLQQKIAELRGGSSTDQVGRTIGSGLVASCIVFLIALTAGFIFYSAAGIVVAKDLHQYPDLREALLITVVATGFSLLSFSMSGINQGLHNSAQVAVAALLANVLFLVVNIVLLLLGYGVISIALSNLVRAVFINVYNMVTMYKWLRRERITVLFERSHFRGFIAIFSFTSVSRIVSGISGTIDNIILARYVSPATITLFEINKRPVKMTQSLIGRHSVALMPAISHARGMKADGDIKGFIGGQFKLYSYAALFAALVFCLAYRYLISAWTGAGQFAGEEITLLLVANFFFYLIGYFMSNMGYALGDIKRNSLVNIIRGLLLVAAIFPVASLYGVPGVLLATLGVTLLTDFCYFTYRLYRLGYLDGGYIRPLAMTWLVVLPLSVALVWVCRRLTEHLFPGDAYMRQALFSISVFTMLFLMLVLRMDAGIREALRVVRKKFAHFFKSLYTHG